MFYFLMHTPSCIFHKKVYDYNQKFSVKFTKRNKTCTSTVIQNSPILVIINYIEFVIFDILIISLLHPFNIVFIFPFCFVFLFLFIFLITLILKNTAIFISILVELNVPFINFVILRLCYILIFFTFLINLIESFIINRFLFAILKSVIYLNSLNFTVIMLFLLNLIKFFIINFAHFVVIDSTIIQHSLDFFVGITFPKFLFESFIIILPLFIFIQKLIIQIYFSNHCQFFLIFLHMFLLFYFMLKSYFHIFAASQISKLPKTNCIITNL